MPQKALYQNDFFYSKSVNTCFLLFLVEYCQRSM